MGTRNENPRSCFQLRVIEALGQSPYRHPDTDFTGRATLQPKHTGGMAEIAHADKRNGGTH